MRSAGVATWQLGGVDLESRGWIVERASMWRPPVSVRRTNVEVPARHGVIAAGPVIFDEPTVNVVVYLPADGRGQEWLEDAQAELIGLLAHPALTVTRISGGIRTSASARLVSVTVEDFLPDTRARATIALALPGVFLRTHPVRSRPIRLGGTAVERQVESLAGSTGPVTDAVLRAAGPLTYLEVTDAATGTGLSWSGALPAGQYVYLDAGSLTAWRSSSAQAWDGGTDVSGGLDYPPGGPLQLWPVMQHGDPTHRQVRVRAWATGTSSETELVIRAGRSYL